MGIGRREQLARSWIWDREYRWWMSKCHHDIVGLGKYGFATSHDKRCAESAKLPPHDDVSFAWTGS